ncbi:MAG TPA: hypothetical protein VFU33_04320 [Gaiellaceae bacterium]|nr:hypothetical protein [Gaiellaceae bacterium]
MWDWAIWAALILVVAAGTASLTLLARRSLTAWRAFKDVGPEILHGLDGFTAKAEAVADKVAAAGDATVEVQESLGRLRISLARLAVLRDALDEADQMLGSVAAAFPRK